MKQKIEYRKPVTEVFDLLSKYLCIEFDPNQSTEEQLGKSVDFNFDDDAIYDPDLWADEEDDE